MDAEPWSAHDAARTANATPASLGLLRRVLVALARLGEDRERPEAIDTAAILGERAAYLHAEAYALGPSSRCSTHVPERTALRGVT